MKVKFSTAVLLAATSICVSCSLFDSKAEQKPANPLVGTWRIDNVQTSQDTSLSYAILAMAMLQDSSGIRLKFTEDIIFTLSKSGADTTLYQYDEKNQQVQLADSSEKPYFYSRLNDSTVSLRTGDSTALTLKKISNN